MPILVRTSAERPFRLRNGSNQNPTLTFVNAEQSGLYVGEANDTLTMCVNGTDAMTLYGNGTMRANVFRGNAHNLVFAPNLIVSNIQITDPSGTPIDDTALDPTGGFIQVNGSGFGPGSVVMLDTSTVATSTTWVSTTQLKAQLPAKTAGTYSLQVVRLDSVTTNVPTGITYSAFPVWTGASDLGTVLQDRAFTTPVGNAANATSDSSISFSLSPTAPTGATMAANGVLSGVIAAPESNTVFSFDVVATDAENQNTSRTFTLNYTAAGNRKLVPSDRTQTPGMFFGVSVHASKDGQYIVGGAISANTPYGLKGAAYIFQKSASGSGWSGGNEIAKVYPANSSVAFPYVGYDVKLSSTGDYLVVGADSGTDANDANYLAYAAGAVYVFYKASTTWTQQAKLVPTSFRVSTDFFGRCLDIDDTCTYLLVGAYGQDTNATGASPLESAGAAYVFLRSGTTWTQQAKLVPTFRALGDNFGTNVRLSGGGDYAIIGAPYHQTNAAGAVPLYNAGAAWIFLRTGATWAQQAKLLPTDRAAEQNFGTEVGISGDGVYAIIGAPYNNTDAAGANSLLFAGAAYIFIRSGATWTQQAKLCPPTRYVQDFAGLSVAISSDGVHCVLNGEGRNRTAPTGLLWHFRRSGTTWSYVTTLYGTTYGVRLPNNFGISYGILGTQLVIVTPASGANVVVATSKDDRTDQYNENSIATGSFNGSVLVLPLS